VFEITWFFILLKLYLKHEQKLINEYEKIKKPVKHFTINQIIWSPKNWIVTKHLTGNEPERVLPVEFSDQFISKNESV
jgi:hypothetical protein